MKLNNISINISVKKHKINFKKGFEKRNKFLKDVETSLVKTTRHYQEKLKKTKQMGDILCVWIGRLSVVKIPIS